MSKERSQEFRDALAQEYLNSTMTIAELSKKYHTDAAYQLKKHGVSLKGRFVQKMLSRGGCISYKWDASTVSTEEQAYTLGFLMADGYNTEHQVGLRLKLSDKALLERIKNCFSDEIKLQQTAIDCSFVISSTIVCKNLLKFGIIKHKSYNEKQLPAIEPSLIRHFIRGYFDGDGTVFICKSVKPNLLKCYICSSTPNILKQIQDILIRNGIDCAINKENRIGKSYTINNSSCVSTMDMYRLFIRRKCAIERLYHYLYDDATIFLQRKYQIFTNNFNLLSYYKHVNTELTTQITKGCEVV